MTAGATTADRLTRRLIDHGITAVYALPGVQNDHLFDAFQRAGAELKVIHTRHEQGAAYMALGAAMATGKPAVFCVAPGPGVLNTTAAISTAYACNAPVICITGQIPSRLIGRGFGILHELPDQLATLRSLTRWSERINAPDEAVGLVDQAFEAATQGRPGPVALECPLDIWPRRGEGAAAAEIAPPVPLEPPMAEGRLAAEAADLVAAARRPLIVVGSGAQHASKEVRELAELIQAPVVAHRMGQGVMDARSRLAANIVAGAEHWATSDLVIGIGTRLQMQQAGWGLDDAIKVVRIEIDPEEMVRFREPDVGLLGDARLETARLVDLLRGRVTPAPKRLREIDEVRKRAMREVAGLEPQLSFLAAIREALPENGIFVDELTQVGYASRLAFPVFRPRTFLAAGYQGTLGWGLPVALGARVACPQSPVVAVSGDGGFLFNVQELATAVQHRIPVAIVLFDDGAYGNVLRTQREDFGGRVIASELRNPDFLRLARSFGAEGVRAEDPGQLRAALMDAFGRNVPTLIVVPVGPMPGPWKFLWPVRKRP